jgi:hypothetical protein
MSQKDNVTPSFKEINCTEKKKYLREVSEDKPKYKKIFEDAYLSSRKSRLNHAQCLYCCCWDREAVRECSAKACPMWNGRPYR